MAVFDINSRNDLYNAIDAINAEPLGTPAQHVINLHTDVTLDRDLPNFDFVLEDSVVINGNNHTIDGVDTYSGFVAAGGAIEINDLTIANMLARGGDGGLNVETQAELQFSFAYRTGEGAGGGGAGLGGGLLLLVNATATLDNVAFTSNSAVGGNGGNANLVTFDTPNGAAGGGGGGGGLRRDGENAVWLPSFPIVNFGGPGADGGGSGLLIAEIGPNEPGGAGGAGAQTSNGNGLNGFNGSWYGGGGGGGGAARPNGTGGNGGNGQFGGGGGGGGGNFQLVNGIEPGGWGGNGGFGGGGGGGSASFYSSNVGIFSSPGGLGGFGAGNGSEGRTIGFWPNYPGSPGSGGGGLGAGAAIFVEQGSTLIVRGGSISGGFVAGGIGGSDFLGTYNGQGIGTGIFLQGNQTMTFAAAAGTTQTIYDTIADQTGNGGTGGNAGVGSLILAGPGTTALLGANSFSGGIVVTGGMLSIASNAGAGSGSSTIELRDGTGILFTDSMTLTHAVTVAGDPIFDVPVGETVIITELISDGAQAGDVEKTGAGTLVLAHTNTYSGGTLLHDGRLELTALNAAGSNFIRFMPGAQTLEIENAALPSNNFGNTIDDFGNEDRIHLSGVSFNSSATYSYVGNLLTIVSNGNSYTLTITDPARTSFAGYNDQGGTMVVLNEATTGTVSLDGSAIEDQTLTVNTNLSDPDGFGSITYQWQSVGVGGGVVNLGFPGALTSHTLSDGDVGRIIRVLVNYTDALGVTQTFSADSAVVQNVNDPPSIANLAGTVNFTEAGAPILLDQGVPANVFDNENVFNSGHLTVSITGGGAAGEDVLGLLPGVNLTLSDGTNLGSTVTWFGTQTGTITSDGRNGSDLVVSFDTGANINVGVFRLLHALTYHNTNSVDPSTSPRTIAVTINDGEDSDTETVTVNVIATNDGPDAVLSTDPYAATEQIALDLKNTGMSVTDVDSGGGGVTATLSVTEGSLTVTAGGSGAGVAGSGTGTVTITGTIAQINALLNTDGASIVSYTNGSDHPGAAATLTLAINDGGNTGTGGALTDQDTSTINITALNDAPVVTAATLAAITEDTASPAGQSVAALFNGHFIDPDDATATITGILVSANPANAATQGTWQYSTGGGNWFDIGAVSDASALALSAATLVRFVPATNFFGAPAALTVYGLDSTYAGGFTVANTTNVQDATGPNGGATAISDNSTTLGTTVNGVNDQPSFAGLGPGPVPFAENGAPVTLDANATIADDELDAANNFGGGTLTLARSGAANADDVFGATGTLSFSGPDVLIGATAVGTFTNAAGALAITFNASATSALVDSVLQQITYSNSNDTPPGTVGIAYVFDDGNVTAQGSGGALQATGAVQVAISATNDAPVNTAPAGPLNAIEDTNLTIAGLAVSDVDAGSALISVTLSVGNGMLTVRTDVPGGVGAPQVSGNGTGTVTLTSPQATINTTLAAANSVMYRGNLDFFGADTLTMTSNDGGASGNDPGGVPGSEQGVATVQINVAAVNDEPFFIAGANRTTNEDSGENLVPSWASKISEGPNEIGQLLTFHVNLTGTTGNLAFSAAPAIDPLTGNLTFTTAAHTNGTATFAVTLSDNGSNVAPNDNTSPVQTFTITVNAVNDAPIFTVQASSTVNEDSGAASIANFASNFQPGPGGATDEASQTLLGYSITGNTNAALFGVAPAIANNGTLTFTPAANARGSATITVIATDSGSGVSPNVNASTPLTFDIVVNSVNDAPVALASSVATTQNTAHAFAGAEFAFSDTLDNNSLAAVVIASLTAHGTLTFNGNPVAVNDVILAGQLGNLVYTPTAGYFGPDSFTFRVRDNGGTTNGGVDTSANTATMSIAVNDITPPAAPVILSFSTNTGAPDDNITSDHTLHLTGTAEAASTVRVFDGGTLLGNTTASGLGNWAFDTAFLTSGLHSLRADATDVSNNTGVLSAALAVNIVPEPAAGPAVPFAFSGIAADFDGDGRNDVLQISGGSALVWLSTGSSFSANQLWAGSATASDRAADVNGDGRADLVQYFGGTEYVALSNGAAAFGAWTPWARDASASDRLADFNGDGRADLLQVYNGRSYVALSNGASFDAFRQWGSGSTVSDRLADLNGDGAADLVQYFGGNQYVALSNGANAFQPWTIWARSGTASDRLADLNGDGRDDLLQVYNGTEYVALSNGANAFQPWTNWGRGATASDRLGDFNGDGRADLLQLYNGTAYVALSNGSSFDTWTPWGRGATAGDRPVDLNGDDRLDLLQVFNGHSFVALSNGTSFDAWHLWV